MSEHTPGPWYISLHGRGRYVRYDFAGQTGFNVCDLGVFGGPDNEKLANAHLIAAAPDLLAACKDMLRYAHYGKFSCESVEAAVAAIAKAEGHS